jgi:hypothetical protein
MTRQSLIQYIKENDSNYERFTFSGHTYHDLVYIKEKIDEEKRKEEQPTLPRMLEKIVRPRWWGDGWRNK